MSTPRSASALAGLPSASNTLERAAAGRKRTGGPEDGRSSVWRCGVPASATSPPSASRMEIEIVPSPPTAASVAISGAAAGSRAARIAASRFDLPAFASPTSAHNGPGANATSRALRKPLTSTSAMPKRPTAEARGEESSTRRLSPIWLPPVRCDQTNGTSVQASRSRDRVRHQRLRGQPWVAVSSRRPHLRGG